MPLEDSWGVADSFKYCTSIRKAPLNYNIMINKIFIKIITVK